MPWKWVQPEVAYHLPDGRSIYHCYKKYGDTMLTYWFTTDPNEDEEYEFDIRDFEYPGELGALSDYHQQDVNQKLKWLAENNKLKWP